MSLEQQLDSIAAQPKAPKVQDGEVLRIDIDLLDTNPYQPRTRIDPAALKEFAESIASKGQLQPILVRPTNGGRYLIVAGHRRTAAFKLLRDGAEQDADKSPYRTIQALVRLALTESELASMGYVENSEREALTPVEEARSLERMIEAGMATTNEELAKLTDQKVARIRNLRRIGRAPRFVREAVDLGVLVVTGKDEHGMESRERRTLEMMAAIQIMALHEHLQKEAPKKADERTQKLILRALAKNWGVRRIEAAVKSTIEGGADDVPDEDVGDVEKEAPLFSRTSKRFTIDCSRLSRATAEQLRFLSNAVDELIQSSGASVEGEGVQR